MNEDEDSGSVEGWEEKDESTFKKLQDAASSGANYIYNAPSRIGKGIKKGVAKSGLKDSGSTALMRLRKMFSFDLGPLTGIIMGLLIISLMKALVMLVIYSVNDNLDQRDISIGGKNVIITFVENCINFWSLILIAVIVIFTIINFTST